MGFLSAFMRNQQTRGENYLAYVNAKDVLPSSLVREIQKYIEGDTIYIPSNEEGTKSKWGQKNGSRERYNQRNLEIKQMYHKNISIDEIAQAFYLSSDSVKKILRK